MRVRLSSPVGWLVAAALSCGGGGSTGDADTGASQDTDTRGEDGESSSSGPQETDGGSSTDAESSGDSGESDGFPADAPTVLFPRTRIALEELAVLVNDDDAQSVAVAEYYVMARGIPEENVVHLSFPPGGSVLAIPDFAPLAAAVEAALAPEIQALAITWTTPYRVGCMSVTSAFALGYDDQWCNTGGGGCAETAESPYWDSDSYAPWTDHQVRPAMMLAGKTAEDVFDLVDRGIAADGTHPTGDGWFVRTTDVARSVRWGVFQQTVAYWDHEGGLDLEYVDNSGGGGSNAISNTQDILFYFTGLAQVPDIATNTYLPGAMADHLTSFGGQVPTSSQMSCVEWLAAGATGSYGTVVEPCNFPTKFPDTMVALPNYFRGQTLVEAYWKSVAWPGEGLFVGEPLAAPWDGHEVTWDPDIGLLGITTNLLRPYVLYHVQEGPTADGPWTTVVQGQIPAEQTLTIEVEEAGAPFYRLVEAP
jgi:uncharacterized protein (TIGR03790 family)